MPQGIVPNPTFYLDREHQPRWSTRLRRRALDEQIAQGAQMDGDERLARRAQELASRTERDSLARQVERMLELAGHASEAHSGRTAPVLSSRVPLRVAEIRDCAEDFDALVARLRGQEPIDAQGIAMTKRLLGNGAGPLYYRRSPVSLRHAVRSARLALEPVSTPAPVELPVAA